MKSLSATASVAGSSACVGAPPCTPGNVRVTPSMTSLLIAQQLHGNMRWFAHLNAKSEIKPDHADHDDAEDDLAGVQQRLRVGDHVADARRRADQLGDDHVGPRPAEHEAQRLRDLRRGARQQHAAHDARGVGAERVGRLDEVAPRRADDHRDHQHDLEEHADEDDEELLRLADAGPQDQERDERGRRQVARERHERLEERLDRLERAHRDAERHADDRGEHEAADHAPDRHRRRPSRSRAARTAPSPRDSIVSGSARNVFDTKPPNVATLHAATNTTKNAMPSATLRARLTGTSGFMVANL